MDFKQFSELREILDGAMKYCMEELDWSIEQAATLGQTADVEYCIFDMGTPCEQDRYHIFDELSKRLIDTFAKRGFSSAIKRRHYHGCGCDDRDTKGCSYWINIDLENPIS